MSGIDVHVEQQHIAVHVDLGDFRAVQTHVGVADHVEYTEIYCAHGRIALPADVLAELLRRLAP